jgi:hypothetical protein
LFVVCDLCAPTHSEKNVQVAVSAIRSCGADQTFTGSGVQNYCASLGMIWQQYPGNSAVFGYFICWPPSRSPDTSTWCMGSFCPNGNCDFYCTHFNNCFDCVSFTADGNQGAQTSQCGWCPSLNMCLFTGGQNGPPSGAQASSSNQQLCNNYNDPGLANGKQTSFISFNGPIGPGPSSVGQYCPLGCVNAVPNCNQCSPSDQTQCQSCAEYFYLQSNVCHSCSAAMPQCTYCTSGTTCTYCNGNYLLSIDGSQCLLSCPVGQCAVPFDQYSNRLQKCVTCSSIIPNCTACSSSIIDPSCTYSCTANTACTQCQVGYYVTANGAGCAVTTCPVGQYLDSFGQCQSTFFFDN